MKHLNDILKESLLDDENLLLKNAEDNAYDSLLGKLKGAWRVIDKTIVYDPRNEKVKSTGGSPTLFLSEDNKGRSINDFTYNQLSNIKKSGLKFQTLEYMTIEYPKIHAPNDILKILPCKDVGMMSLWIRANGCDFNKFDGKINHVIQIFPHHEGIIKGLNVVPPKYHIGLVNYGSSDSMSNLLTTIKNWDCDYLFVPGYDMMCGVLDYHKPGVICGFWIDKIQELIDANPNAKEIYIYDNQNYWRCSYKGSGNNRKLVDLTNRTSRYVDKIKLEYQWKCKNEAEEDTRKLLSK